MNERERALVLCANQSKEMNYGRGLPRIAVR